MRNLWLLLLSAAFICSPGCGGASMNSDAAKEQVAASDAEEAELYGEGEEAEDLADAD
ncbi:MAG: hypothetical protein AAF483_00945 [Planctomycetota bacterium]